MYTVRFKWSEERPNHEVFEIVRILILIKKIKKIKKMLAFCWNMLYSIFCWRVNEMRTMRSVGQAAKTSPSHGENQGFGSPRYCSLCLHSRQFNNLRWSVGQAAKTVALSRRKQGFDSPTDCYVFCKTAQPVKRTCKNTGSFNLL